MAFYGLFIGINRYADSRVSRLAGAVRDATALHALFHDALPTEEGKLLVDEEATTAAVAQALKDLARRATSDDTVVVSYAGHGSDNHYLLTHDVDAADLVGSGISLDRLGELIGDVPAKTLLCALDCCFSGGIGARVFATNLRPRNAGFTSLATRLERFTGEGRLVFTASADDEEALESQRHGHGLFTYRLLEALQGAPEVVDGEQVNLYKLIQHVTAQVLGDSQQLGQTQTPTLRGQLDGVPTWPVLRPGATYAALFPERVRAPATADLRSLLAFGLARETIEAWARRIPALNALQLSAINDYGLLDGENVVVTAPTSSGKTMIGELAALQAAATGGRSIFLLPMKALVNDKYAQFVDLYAAQGLSVVRASGDYSDQVGQLLRGQFDIALLTYEKFTNLVLANKGMLRLAATVIIDEAQILADSSRGANLEFLLTLLSLQRGRTGLPQLVTLSAVVGHLNGFERWLGARNLHSTVRPVPLKEGLLHYDGSLRSVDDNGQEAYDAHFLVPYPHQGNRSLLIPLAQKIIAEGKKLIVFRQSKGESVAGAVYLSQSLGLEPVPELIEALRSGDSSAGSETLARTLAAGVAFHNADLGRDERRLVEETFRDPASLLRVVVATPTLAMGVNTPAEAVAIVGLVHPGPTPTRYSVAEYKNMVGRAGRLGLAAAGESYLIPGGDATQAWSHYLTGALESLRSQLVPDGDPRTLMLRVLAAQPVDADGAVSEHEVLEFLDASFAAFTARAGAVPQWNEVGLRNGFQQLVSAQLITPVGSGYRLTDLGRFVGESGTHVDSVRRLVAALRHLPAALPSTALIAAAQLTVELDAVYIPGNARAINTEVPRWPNLLQQQHVPGHLVSQLTQTAGDGKRALSRTKRAAAAILWVNGLPMQAIEGHLTQHLRESSVAGPVLSTVDRTRDLLPAVGAVLRELHGSAFDGTLIDRTMSRLEFGMPPVMIDLVTVVGDHLSRAQLLALHNAGLHGLEVVLRCDVVDLAALVGGSARAVELQARCRAASEEASQVQIDLPVPTE